MTSHRATTSMLLRRMKYRAAWRFKDRNRTRKRERRGAIGPSGSNLRRLVLRCVMMTAVTCSVVVAWMSNLVLCRSVQLAVVTLLLLIDPPFQPIHPNFFFNLQAGFCLHLAPVAGLPSMFSNNPIHAPFHLLYACNPSSLPTILYSINTDTGPGMEYLKNPSTLRWIEIYRTSVESRPAQQSIDTLI